MKKTIALILVLVLGLLLVPTLTSCSDVTTESNEEVVEELPTRFVYVDDIGGYDAGLSNGNNYVENFSYIVDVETRNVYITTGRVSNNGRGARAIFPLYDADGNIYKYEGKIENLG